MRIFNSKEIIDFKRIKRYINKFGEKICIKYADDDHKIKVSETYSNKKGYHRLDDQPAITRYNAKGQLIFKAYYVNGNYHRENNKPAIISYSHGKVISEEYFINNHKKRTDGGPQKVDYNLDNGRCVETYIDKEYDFYNETTKIGYNKYKTIIFVYKYLDGELNSNYGEPSCLNYYENGNIYLKKYHKEGLLHNNKGKPALTMYDIDGNIKEEKYYIDGEEYDPLEYMIKIEIDKNKDTNIFDTKK